MRNYFVKVLNIIIFIAVIGSSLIVILLNSTLSKMKLKVFHTQARDTKILDFPEIAEGEEQWLGDGFYFWQDYDFAEWWGEKHKCKKWNKTRIYDIYVAEIEFNDDEFLDTVFNENDYYNFKSTVEKWAKIFQRKKKKRPTLEEFNLFIENFDIWKGIKVIRFQDIPENDRLVEVDGFYYKKRIQTMVNMPEIISSFEHFKEIECLT